MSATSRGTRREHQVKRLLEDGGWLVIRAAGSLGPVDLVALKAEHPALLVQVKTDASGPYKNFGPTDRLLLRHLAARSGAEAWLVWWPAGRKPAWKPPDAWPRSLTETR